MSLESNRVKKAYAKLTESEKEDVKLFIKKYDDASYFEKGSLNESIENSLKASTGPKDSSGCVCCGK